MIVEEGAGIGVLRLVGKRNEDVACVITSPTKAGEARVNPSGFAAAQGWRGRALVRAGVCLVAVAVVLVVVRGLLVPSVAQAVVSNAAYRAGARAAWSTSTTMAGPRSSCPTPAPWIPPTATWVCG